MSDHEIRVLSLNCWGLKFVAKNRSERIAGIAKQLANLSHDIIALQEIWVFADFEHVRDSVSSRLPYSKFFYSGALGSGLALLSRFPIISATIYPYSLNGAPMDVSAGDWFVGKAAATIIIAHPVLGQVQVFNTHLFAKGGEDGPEYNRAHRLVNAWEFSKLVRQAADLGRYVIAAGDFNSVPTTLPMTLIREHTSLQDSWLVTHPPSSSATRPSSANISPEMEAISRYGVTADSPLNSYSAGKPLDPHARKFAGKRLDYIMYREPTIGSHSSPLEGKSMPILKSTSCKVLMTERVPGFDFSFSDHFALESTLQISTSSSSDASSEETTNAGELTPASIISTIQALTSCYRFARHRSRRELVVFALCILLLFAIAVGSAWIPYPWITPMLIVFTVGVSWLGTTLLYEGFLYGNWELNALMNVIEELEIHKANLEKSTEGRARISGSSELRY